VAGGCDLSVSDSLEGPRDMELLRAECREDSGHFVFTEGSGLGFLSSCQALHPGSGSRGGSLGLSSPPPAGDQQVSAFPVITSGEVLKAGPGI
jgi:hypothetical protein